MRSHHQLIGLELPAHDPPSPLNTAKRFLDGGQYRVEIPSVEGPAAMSAVLKEAERRAVTVHRVSQGSGIFMLTNDEIAEMVALGAASSTEVCLFVGPRASWDVGVQSHSVAGSVVAGAARGSDQLAFALEDVNRAVELGARSVLVADLGLLMVLGTLRRQGDLPANLILKVSVQLPVANPATARVLEDLGADTLNLPVDLSVPMIASIRMAVDAPIDLYIESSDEFGGVVRYYDVPEIVRVASPVYLKFTMRNAQGTYPSGEHLAAQVESMARERVRRSQLGMEQLQRHYPSSVMSPKAMHAVTTPRSSREHHRVAMPAADH